MKELLSNKALIYLITRYGTFGLQFINSLFIAHLLGPYYLGVWGFITLIIQYLNQFNLGIAQSANTIMAIHKDRDWYLEKVVGNAFSMLLVLSIVSFTLLVFLTLAGLGNKFEFFQFIFPVGIIACLNYLNNLMLVVYRIKNQYSKIAFSQSSHIILISLCLFVFKGDSLLWALLSSNLIGFLISFFLFLYRSPIRIKLNFDYRLFKKIQLKGIYLYLYNTSFYLIILSTRTFVSSFYSIVEFGLFTFAFSMANVGSLLLNAIAMLAYPKLLNRLAKNSNDRIIEILSQFRQIYIPSSHFLIHFSILVFPILLYLFPEYSSSRITFNLIAITIGLQALSFGYSGLLIAKGLENKIAIISLFSLFVNLMLSLVLSMILHVSFDYLIIATLFTYTFYNYLLFSLSRKVLSLPSDFASIFIELFPVKISLPLSVSLVLTLSKVDQFLFIIPFILFLLLNFSEFKNIISTFKKFRADPNFMNV